MAITNTNLSAFRLFQLSSASLPVGAYAFSQGLEYAVEAEWLGSLEDAHQWLELVVYESMVQVDLPLLIRLYSAARREDIQGFNYWNDFSFACRETKELCLSEAAQGEALRRLLLQLEVPVHEGFSRQLAFVSTFAIAASYWKISVEETCRGYLWSWVENQVAAATKLVPLGQTDSQRLLGRLQPVMLEALNLAQEVDDEGIGASLPGLAMASAWHETQYTRIFRS